MKDCVAREFIIRVGGFQDDPSRVLAESLSLTLSDVRHDQEIDFKALCAEYQTHVRVFRVRESLTQ